MKSLVWFSFIVIFLLPTSCNILLSDIQMTTDPEYPSVTQLHSEETNTPVGTNWQETESPTPIITPEIPNETSIRQTKTRHQLRFQHRFQQKQNLKTF
jgi:hypothetical protein